MRRALALGLGVGAIACALAKHGCSVDGVELDLAVVQYARRDFDIGVRESKMQRCSSSLSDPNSCKKTY